ncbi:MAG TPA: HPP family protein [Devosia sp.]|nr:HPP family protein [Devosia sp.]
MTDPRPPFRLFQPILAGATLRERIIGCIGALLAISLTGFISSLATGGSVPLPLIVAPMGASAVLLFAVPSSPLAQPWPVIGGNTIAALVGVAVTQLVHDPMLASGLAVGLAIAAMSLTRSLHPPGGAAALTAVIGGPAVAASGFMFAVVPVALNSVVLVLCAIAFHRLTKRNYPHVPARPAVNQHNTADRPADARVGFTDADVDAALAALDETFDIDRDDLARLLRRVEIQALSHSRGPLQCADIMSRDVIAVRLDDSTETALAALLSHNIRTLPVLDAGGRLAGTIGLRELAGQAPTTVRALVSPAVTAAPGDLATTLLPVLTDGRCHAVIITAPAGDVIGLLTQTDLLAGLSRPVASTRTPGGAITARHEGVS